MSRHATDAAGPEPECASSPPLPAGHVLDSGAVLFPGAFDQHGCPLIVFPVDGQAKLSTQLSKNEVVDFINYFQRVHSKKLEKECLVSLVADLRHASLPTVRFITETLLLLELHKRTVHSVYIIQPQKKEALKLLMKLLTPSKFYPTSLKKVLLKEISELSNYIDKSQLPASLGGYLIYCHHSWVSFVKEIDTFAREFVSVVQRLPSCISTLYALSRMPLPSTFTELQLFCSTNEATFQQLRRELGLDELLRHCEIVLEKLHYPEKDPCYLAMAGTALFTHTTFDMLQNHSRITAAVEKVELLWQQAFAKARLQLQVFQLREDALQITEQIKSLHQEKLQPYKIEVAKDDAKALKLVSEFEATIYTPAVALVRCAEDVIHTLAEILPFEGQIRDHWVLDLERLKEKVYSAVQFILQTLRSVSKYHRNYKKASCWYSLVLHENILQELLSGVNGDTGSPRRQRKNWAVIPAWRQRISSFLTKHPPPDKGELVLLAHLSGVIPDEEIHQAGKQMSQRCITLRKLLMSSEPVAVGYLQRALQWQYELLRSNYSSTDCAAEGTAHADDAIKCKDPKETTSSPRTSSAAELVSAHSTPLSLSSFDSGFDGVGNGQLEDCGGRERPDDLCRLTEITDSEKRTLILPQINKDSSACSDVAVQDEEFDCGSVGDSSGSSIQIVPKAAADSLNFEIRVRRSAALPSNPWLSLPVDNLENSYTITITPNPTPQKKSHQLQDPSDPSAAVSQLFGCRNQPTQTEALPRASKSKDRMLSSQSTLEDPELSPVCHILSSTITEEISKSLSTTEGAPTLLWDSYDLHEQNQDSVDFSIDLSLKDWDVKEQENLKEVEKMLDRTDEILEKEENVLAQEAVLDALLSSESQPEQWMWDKENQTGGMASRELAEAGFLGLEDELLPAESDRGWEPKSTASECEMKVSDDRCNKMMPEVDAQAFHSSSDLLTELRQVHLLDEMIVEERLKIHMFRQKERPDEELSRSKSQDSNRLPVRKEREAFRLQLEKEKQEVDKLEKSLENECEAKKQRDKSKKVIRCSIMEKTRTEEKDDKAHSHDLSGTRNRSHATHATFLVCRGSEPEPKTEHHEEAPDHHILIENASNHPIQLPASQADHFECETLVLGRNTSDVKPVQLLEGVLSENPTKPEASLTPELGPDDGAFDPGGNWHIPPATKPRNVLLVKDKPSENEAPYSTETQIPSLSSATDLISETAVCELPESSDINHSLAVTANVKEHHNNDNNNQTTAEKSEIPCFSETNIKDEDDTSVVFKCLEEENLQLVEEMRTLSPASQCLLPEPPPELELSGRDHQDEDLADGVQPPDWLKVSGCESADSEAQLDISFRKITDFKTPIVLDTGSGLMKAGFADQDLPNVVFPTIIGMPKYEEIMNGRAERETYIGHEAQHMRGVLALKHPIKNGIIQNWDEMEKIWHHTFLQMRVDPEDHPVLLTEAAMNPLENRRRMVEIMFERFNVPFTYVAVQAVLSLYASGRSTGVVFDSGDGVSHSVPVFDGHYLPHAVQRFPLAGVDVTLHLIKLLQEQGVCMRTTAEVEIAREMKEKCCRVALNYEAELNAGGSSCREMHFTMPDGQIVTLNTERFRAPEILFKPELIGRDHCGIHESLFKSILSSDIDLRRSLLQNIVLSGGNTLLSGFPERLQAEIKGLLAPDAGENVHVSSPEDRDFTVWSGGAMLASLQSFNTAWISLEEYEEQGPQIVHRKCF